MYHSLQSLELLKIITARCLSARLAQLDVLTPCYLLIWTVRLPCTSPNPILASLSCCNISLPELLLFWIISPLLSRDWLCVRIARPLRQKECLS